METSLKRIVSKITGFWKNAGKKTKGLLIGASALLVVLVVILEVAVNHVSYTLLYSGLSDSEAGQIVTQLKSMSVSYRLSGSQIYVDKSKADETRMELAENGYPQSTLNYSVYTGGTSWATTDSDKKRMALYQTQNRLQDTVNTIPGVKSSVVTIGESDDTTYVLESDKVPVTASVKLSLQNGTTLTQKQVNGIVQLISHSVADLSSDNVTVLDSDGNDLSSAGSSLSGSTSDQLELQSQVESEMRRKVLSVLTPIFGSGNVVVAAGATLDFSDRTTSSVTYASPNSGSTVGLPSAQSGAATVSGTTGTGASGVAGVNNGTTAYTTTGSSTASGGAVTQTNSQASYLYNTVNEQVQSKGATLKNLTISVQVNSKSQSAANVDVASIRQAVAYAVGMTDPANVSVQLLPFATAATSSAATKTQGGMPSIPVIAAAVGVGVVLLAAAAVLLWLHRRRVRREREEAAAAAAAAEAEAAQLKEELAEKQKQKQKPAPEPGKSLEEKLEESGDNELKKQISDFADQKPELVAQLLKNWLKD